MTGWGCAVIILLVAGTSARPDEWKPTHRPDTIKWSIDGISSDNDYKGGGGDDDPKPARMLARRSRSSRRIGQGRYSPSPKPDHEGEDTPPPAPATGYEWTVPEDEEGAETGSAAGEGDAPETDPEAVEAAEDDEGAGGAGGEEAEEEGGKDGEGDPDTEALAPAKDAYKPPRPRVGSRWKDRPSRYKKSYGMPAILRTPEKEPAAPEEKERHSKRFESVAPDSNWLHRSKAFGGLRSPSAQLRAMASKWEKAAAGGGKAGLSEDTGQPDPDKPKGAGLDRKGRRGRGGGASRLRKFKE